MKRTFYVNAAAVVCIFSFLISCKSPTSKARKESVPSDVTADSVLNMAKSKIFTPQTDNQVKTILHDASYTVLGDRTVLKKRINLKYYLEKPDTYKYIVEYVIRKTSTTSSKDKYELVKLGQNYTLFVNGEELKPTDENILILNELKDDAEKGDVYISLGIFQNFLDVKLSKKFYSIDGSKCYRLDVVMNKRLRRWPGNKFSYYIDSNTYLIKKITGSHGTFSVDKIKYEEVQGKVMPQEFIELYKGVLKGTSDDITKYYRLNDSKINSSFDSGIFLKETKHPKGNI